MGKAMALDKLMAKMNSARGYHTLTNNYVISNKGTDDEGMVGGCSKEQAVDRLAQNACSGDGFYQLCVLARF